MKRLLLIALAAPLLAACPSMPPREQPQTFVERVLGWEKQAQAVERSVDGAICHRGYDAQARCLDPGKPLRPAVGLAMLETMAKVRAGLRASVRIPVGATGLCLPGKDEPLTAEQCLAAATGLERGQGAAC